jgi:hypothetical protein
MPGDTCSGDAAGPLLRRWDVSGLFSALDSRGIVSRGGRDSVQHSHFEFNTVGYPSAENYIGRYHFNFRARDRQPEPKTGFPVRLHGLNNREEVRDFNENGNQHHRSKRLRSVGLKSTSRTPSANRPIPDINPC